MSTTSSLTRDVCACFGDGDLQASTFYDVDGNERCSWCRARCRSDFDRSGNPRIFWALLGLSWVLTSMAIYGAWTDRLSPMLNWPLWMAGAGCIVLSTRFRDRR